MAFENVKKIAEADFPTRWGAFRILGFEGTLAEPRAIRERPAPAGAQPASPVEGLVALVMGDIHSAPPVVRIHSQCLTGDVFGSLRCDCRPQLELAMRRIAQEGAGILLYEEQEGRGIGLMAKLKAYELQDQGLDTVEANVKLGFTADCREYELPAEVLKLLGVSQVRLITNNPEKMAALESAGITVVERLSAEVEPLESFERYLRTKVEKMGHIQDSASDSTPGAERDSPKGAAPGPASDAADEPALDSLARK
jgi:GTP cyclohydrolase II